MSNLPQVAVGFSNGNLTIQVAVIDGNAAIAGSGHTAANYGKTYIVNNLTDAETQGLTAVLEPEAHRQLQEFYGELAGKQQAFVQLFDPAITMAAMLDSTNPANANKLITLGAGKIAYLGLFKVAPVGYSGGTDYIDADVSAAIIAANTFVEAWNNQGFYFRVLIGGYVINESSNVVFAPNTSDVGAAGVVLGSTKSDKGSSVGLVLGRKVKYSCQIKQGKVANGPLSVTTMFIGTKALSNVTNLDALAGAGYMIPVTYPNRAGFYFGVDNMASTDDYRLLVYGAVIDAAARVSYAYYTNWLEGEIDVDGEGKLLDNDAAHLESNIIAQIKSNLGDRISDVDVAIDRGQVIVPGNTLSVQLRVIPKGYFTFINVDLGFTV